MRRPFRDAIVSQMFPIYGRLGGGGAVVSGAPVPAGGGAWPLTAAGGGACSTPTSFIR